MQRIAVVATLRPGTAEQAARLIELGPPFDPLDNGLGAAHGLSCRRHGDLRVRGRRPARRARCAHRRNGQSVLGAWESLVDGTPKVAREAYSWIRPAYAGWQEGWGE